MQINIKATQLDLTPSLKAYIERKLGSLAKFIKPFEKEGQPEIWMEIARTTRHHHRGEVFLAEADLRLPGKTLRATHRDIDARAAIDRLKDKLHLEIEKYKTQKIRRPRRQSVKAAIGKPE